MIALFKHAKNFVFKNGSRPIFEGIHFDGKRAIVTNTHLAVIVNNVPFEKRTIHWKTGEEITGDYPNIDKVVPAKTKYTTEFTDINEFICGLKTAMLIKKDDYGNIVSLYGTLLECESKNAKIAIELSGTVIKGPNPRIYFSAKYLLDILNFFKDAGVEHFTFGFNEPLGVFKITPDKDMLAVLTPIRVTDTAKKSC